MQKNSKPQHTPAPWSVMPNDDGNISSTIVAGKFKLASVPVRDWNPDSQAERHANASLIAAAPELLEALQKYVDFEEICNGDDAKQFPRYVKARAAIAKAAQ